MKEYSYYTRVELLYKNTNIIQEYPPPCRSLRRPRSGVSLSFIVWSGLHFVVDFKGTAGGVSRMARVTFFHMFFTCLFQVPSEPLFSGFQLPMPLKMELKFRKNKTRGQFFFISGKPCFCNTLQCFCYILRVRGNLNSIKYR